MDIKCPACGSDHTQKLSLFVRSSTFTGKGEALGAGSAGGHLGVGVAITQGTSASRSAREYAEPAAEPIFGPAAALLVVSFALWIFFGSVVAGILLALGAVGITAMIHKNLTEVPRLHAEWMRKFICLRCSTVWAPAP